MPKIAVHGGPTDQGQPGYLDLGRSFQSPEVTVSENEPEPVDEPAPTLEADGDEYDSWTYSELQAECRRRELSAQGSAGALIERLREYDEQD